MHSQSLLSNCRPPLLKQLLLYGLTTATVTTSRSRRHLRSHRRRLHASFDDGRLPLVPIESAHGRCLSVFVHCMCRSDRSGLARSRQVAVTVFGTARVRRSCARAQFYTTSNSISTVEFVHVVKIRPPSACTYIHTHTLLARSSGPWWILSCTVPPPGLRDLEPLLL